jgi:dTDP-4-dehydrorhamnose 3,5-epimerase
LGIADVVVVAPQRFSDARGYFAETYRTDEFLRFGITATFVQDNEAASLRQGTIRGLHFQRGDHAQAKLVRVVAGAIFDVAVDLREGSPTRGRWVGATLSADGGEQLFMPRGFAHGYCTLRDNTVVAYKCDNVYAREHEGGIHFADPAIGIAWPIASEAAIVSDKDRALPLLAAELGPAAAQP